MTEIRTLPLADFHAELKCQGVSAREHLAFVCPICGTVQSAQDLIDAGAGRSLETVERFIGFSCIGRFTGAGAHRKGAPAGHGCNWTLGGLFQLHDFAVIDDDGKAHPHFRPASAAEAQSHEQAWRRRAELGVTS